MHVDTGATIYPVVVARNTASILADAVDGRRVLAVASVSSNQHVAVLTAKCSTVEVFQVPDGEAAKTLLGLQDILCWLSNQRATPHDVLVAIGGGALTDLAGFAAGVWRRGMPWIVAPTTFACAVDAGIGAKITVNTTAGKNTAGRLWDPQGVIIDLDTFSTLAPTVVADGLAEVVKVVCTHDSRLIDVILAGPGAVSGRWLGSLVEVSAQVAFDVASGRFGPGANKDVLSVGHEIAHALEALSGFTVKHGFAVSVGLRYVHRVVAPEMYRVHPKRLDETLWHCRLPFTATEAGVDVSWGEVRAELVHDKRMANELKFLLPVKAGTCQSSILDEAHAAATWSSLG